MLRIRLRRLLGFLLWGFAWYADSPGASAEMVPARLLVLTPLSGATPEDLEISRSQVRAGRADGGAAAFERLGWAFVAKARRTLDSGFYLLAEKAAEVMEADFGASTEARLLRGHVAENLHHFKVAETIARELVASRGSAADFGLLSDALMEQGRLEEAADALRAMVERRPGAEAYSRVAHLRWLKGDLAGATAAMETALQAVSPRDAASVAWLLVRLADYYGQAGGADRALTAAEAARRNARDYPPAEFARGKALLALGRRGEAVAALRRAAELNPLPEYQWWLADALRMTAANEETMAVESALKVRGEATDPRGLALFLATRGVDGAEAERLAREELSNRADVFTHDALAWALAARGNFPAAAAEMRIALRETTDDARLFLHAGEIARGVGQDKAAVAFFVAAKRREYGLTPSECARLREDLASEPARVVAPEN